MLTDRNIEAELSYAYLHAVATRAGFSCEYRNRHLDGAGVDATITEDGRMLADDSILTSFCVDVQLKATYRELHEQEGRISSLTVPHYDKLRIEEIAAPRVLLVLRLPQNPEEWLQITRTHSSRNDVPTGSAFGVHPPARMTRTRRFTFPERIS